jgi:hypothetical protein
MWCTNTAHNKFDGLKQLTYVLCVFVVPHETNYVSFFDLNVFSELVHLTCEHPLQNTNAMDFKYLFVVYLITLSVIHIKWCWWLDDSK